jgi:diguanylate cyclase (GGDEF)-like protein
VLWVLGSTAIVGPVVVGVESRFNGAVQWSRFGPLLVMAFLVPFFSVRGIHRQTHLLTSAVFMMALVLLPAALSVALAVAAVCVDWVKRRYLSGDRAKLSGISAFHNGLVVTAAILAAYGLTRILGPHHDSLWGLWPLVVGCVYIAISEGLTSVYIHLGWGESIRDLLHPDSLATEVALASAGAAAGLLWLAQPGYSLLLIAPLGLAHLAQRVAHLKVEAAQDAKTRLLNSAHFEAELADEVERAGRRGLPVALLAADLDLLRDVNNRHGHVAGDAIIIGFADVIRAHLRRSDLAGRFGGEEFLVLLPATTVDEAAKVAERIRNAFATSIFAFGGQEKALRGTVSIGVAAFPEDASSAAQLLKAADRALYEAKALGRNRVARIDEPAAARPAITAG